MSEGEVVAVVTCPKCRAQLDLDDEYLGREVDCGACGGVFVAKTDRPRPEPRDEDDDYDRPLGRQYDEDDEDDDYDRPRRRRRRRGDDFATAEQIVAGPANGLIWTGIVGALLNVLGG